MSKDLSASRGNCPVLPLGTGVRAGSPGKGTFEVGFEVWLEVHRAGRVLWAVRGHEGGSTEGPGILGSCG